MAKFFYAIITFVLIYPIECVDSETCVQKNSCLCEFSEYSKIDLSQATSKDGKPQFLKDEKDNISFYFYGCTDGSLNITVNNSTVSPKGSLIRISKNNTQIDVIGTSDQIKFNTISENGHIKNELTYKKDQEVVANVRLICEYFNEPFIKVLKNDGPELILALTSQNACIITRHPGLSTGSVLVILFCIGVGIYFVCGGLILYFIRGARGLEIIPNIDFWRELPGLTKDGLIFIFSGCNPNTITTPAETYDRI